MEQLKFGDSESISFVKKSSAKLWMKEHLDDVLNEFEASFGDTHGSYHIDNEEDDVCINDKFSIDIQNATDYHFWFTISCVSCGWIIYGTIFRWRAKRWKACNGHVTPKPRRDAMGQMRLF